MKLPLRICSLLLFALNASSQTTKGLSVPKPAETTVTGKTYALIVGVSKYKNPAIPQLQYADRDAMAFSNYLKASGVDSNNISLLLNENATFINVMQSLDAMCNEKAAKGDIVFFYFSGHGDVESRVITNDGYLLPYDAPKMVYAISAININILQTYISTLSAKGVQAVVITDACHSGNLSGGIEGLKNISNVLKTEWKDEMKVLSCQPGELSLEGPQWGDGRGLFSYELINGMAGMADKNNDGVVSLRELNLYLMEKVPEQANPSAQNPLLSGDMGKTISKTNKKYLDDLASSSRNNTYAAVSMKGSEDGLLKGLPDSVVSDYKSYKACLEANNLYKPKNAPSAYYYLSKMPEDKTTVILTGLMKRNLAAAIIKKSNEILETFMNNNLAEAFQLGMRQDLSKEVSLLRQLLSEQTIKLLNYEPKILFWEAAPVMLGKIDSQTVSIAKDKINSAIKIDPDNASLFLSSGIIKAVSNDTLAGINDLKYAIVLSPKLSPCYRILGFLYELHNNEDSATKYYKQFLQLDFAMESGYFAHVLEYLSNRNKITPGSFDSIVSNMDARASVVKFGFGRFADYLNLGDMFLKRKDYPKSIMYYRKAWETSSKTLVTDYDLADEGYNLALTKIMEAMSLAGDKDSATFYFNKTVQVFNDGLQKDPLNYKAYYSLGRLYFDKSNYTEAEKCFFKCLELNKDTSDSRYAFYFRYLAGIERKLKKYAESKMYSNEMIKMNPNDPVPFYALAKTYSMENDNKNALANLEKSIGKGIMKDFNDYNGIVADADLTNIRSTPEYKALMKKYFPNDYKE